MLTKHSILRTIAGFALIFTACLTITAQTADNVQAATARAIVLIELEQYAEALPHMEIVVKANPTDPKVRFLYGWCLIGKSKQISDTAEAKALSEKALAEFKEAKKLGLNDPMNDSLIALLSGGSAVGIGSGSGRPMYSENAEAEKTMLEAEGLFARSRYDEAIKLFEKVLTIDPKVYQAAVSGADSFVAKSDWENAEKWYQRAIAIDPNRETAYRYSATPMMRQNKHDQARERYIEAVIVEPYNQMSYRGISQWANVTGARLSAPDIDVPEVTFDTSGKATPKTAIDAKDAAASPWLTYLSSRELWRKEKFAKAFPAEKLYRHSLMEEAESLRAAIKAAAEIKSSNKQFETLARLDSEGLLESYILLNLANEGIAEDHPEYLKNNRPKLRTFFANYIIRK